MAVAFTCNHSEKLESQVACLRFSCLSLFIHHCLFINLFSCQLFSYFLCYFVILLVGLGWIGSELGLGLGRFGRVVLSSSF